METRTVKFLEPRSIEFTINKMDPWPPAVIKSVKFKKLLANIDRNLLKGYLLRLYEFLRTDQEEFSLRGLSLVSQEVFQRIVDYKYFLCDIRGECREIANKILGLFDLHENVFVVSCAINETYQENVTFQNNPSQLQITDSVIQNGLEDNVQVFSSKRARKNKRRGTQSDIPSKRRRNGVENTRCVVPYSYPQVPNINFQPGGLILPSNETDRTIQPSHTIHNDNVSKQITNNNCRVAVNTYKQTTNNKTTSNATTAGQDLNIQNKQMQAVKFERGLNGSIDNEVIVKGLTTNKIVLSTNADSTDSNSLVTKNRKKLSKKLRSSQKYNQLPTTRMKTIEALQKPIEIDKSIRMMHLMGWTGGALGAREDGIKEPIMPTLDLVNRAGLGHTKKEQPAKGKQGRASSLPRLNATQSKLVGSSSDNNINEQDPPTSENLLTRPTRKSKKEPRFKFDTPIRRVPTLFRQEFLLNVLGLINDEETTRVITYESRLSKKEKMFIHNALRCFTVRKRVHLVSADEMDIATEIVDTLVKVPDVFITCTVGSKCEVKLQKVVNKLRIKAEVTSSKKVWSENHLHVTADLKIPDDIDLLIETLTPATVTQKYIDNLKFRLEVQLKILNFLKTADNEMEMSFDSSLLPKQVCSIKYVVSSINKRVKFCPSKVEGLVSEALLEHVGNVQLNLKFNTRYDSFTVTKSNIGAKTSCTPLSSNNNSGSVINAPNIFTQNIFNIQENTTPTPMQTGPSPQENITVKTPSIFTQNIFNIQENIMITQDNSSSAEDMELHRDATDNIDDADGYFDLPDKSSGYTTDDDDEIEVLIEDGGSEHLVFDDDEQGKDDIKTDNEDDDVDGNQNKNDNVKDDNTDSKNTEDVSENQREDPEDRNKDIDDVDNKNQTKIGPNKKYTDKDSDHKLDWSIIDNDNNNLSDKTSTSNDSNSYSTSQRVKPIETDKNKGKENIEMNLRSTEIKKEVASPVKKEIDAPNETEHDSPNKESRVKNQVDNENIICITSKEYPKEIISDKQVKEVQLIISSNIQTMKILPLLKCHGVQNGVLIYSCHSKESYKFLIKILSVVSSIKIEPKIVDTLEFKVACFFDCDVSYLLNLVEIYNEGLSTKEWKVREVDTSANTITLIVKMDNESLDYILNSNFSLYAGFDTIDFKIYLT